MSDTAERCDYCGRRWDRPGCSGCPPGHAVPDLAQSLVRLIEDDLTDRRGLRGQWEMLDDEIRDEIRDEWARLIRQGIAEQELRDSPQG
jgi:hypothetical protein